MSTKADVPSFGVSALEPASLPLVRPPAQPDSPDTVTAGGSPETHALPSSDGATPEQTVGAGTAEASPSAVASAEAALILRYTHLKEQLPALETDVAEATISLRLARAELRDIVRLLAAHKRLREPIKRRKP